MNLRTKFAIISSLSILLWAGIIVGVLAGARALVPLSAWLGGGSWLRL